MSKSARLPGPPIPLWLSRTHHSSYTFFLGLVCRCNETTLGKVLWKQRHTAHSKKRHWWPMQLCEVVKRTLSGTRYCCSLTQELKNVYVSHFCCFCHSLGSLSLLTFPHLKSFKAFWLKNEKVVPCPQSDTFTTRTWDPDVWTAFPNSFPFIDSPPQFPPLLSSSHNRQVYLRLRPDKMGHLFSTPGLPDPHPCVLMKF